VRLFLALDIPPAMRATLASLRQGLEPCSSGWRWVRSESIHATIRFLGEVPRELDGRARPAWRRAARAVPGFRFRLGQLGCFPPSGRPRVAWVGMIDEPAGSLAALASRVEAEARGLGFEAERRPFRPHLTLARAARAGRPVLGRAAVDHGSVAHAGELRLFRSELRPDGARYTALEAFPLDPSSDAGQPS